MLQAPHNNTWMNANAFSKRSDGFFGTKRTESVAVLLRYKNIVRPLIGLLLSRISAMACIRVIQKDGFFGFFAVCMQKDVGRLVEKGEPELVVGLAIKRKLYERSGWAKPARHTAYMGTRDCGNNCQQHACRP